MQVPSLGLAAFFTAAMCTSFASVYFEKMLKSDSQPSLWLRNIQLAGKALPEGPEPSMRVLATCIPSRITSSIHLSNRVDKIILYLDQRLDSSNDAPQPSVHT